jgi:hypothetical protein
MTGKTGLLQALGMHSTHPETIYPFPNDPVRGPEDRAWSSFRHYATGVEEIVEIESEWTGRKREKGMVPSHAPNQGHPPHRRRPVDGDPGHGAPVLGGLDEL